MAGIASYNGLQSRISDWLLRSDLDDVIPTFIDNAESVLRRDSRVRNLTTTTLDTADGTATVTLPEDYRSLEGLWYDGPTYFGRIRTVDPATLGDVEGAQGESDTPTHAAYIGSRMLRFAPVPDDVYTLRLSYWATIKSLSDNRQSNWLLDEHPDVYLYASLVESAPYLRDDSRLQTWTALLESRLNDLHLDITDKQYSGHMSNFPQRNIP